MFAPTADWVSAAATVVGTLAVLAGLPAILKQVTEARRAASAAVVADFYNRVTAAAPDRRLVAAHSDKLRAVVSAADADALAASDPALHAAVLRAANTYQYLGLLLDARLLDRRTEQLVLIEAEAAYERFMHTAGSFLQAERLSRGQESYKGHLATVSRALARVKAVSR